MELLNDALLSLAGADYAPLEAIVVTQQFLPAQISELESLIARYVWNEGSGGRVVNFASSELKDHRSALLNRGLDAANGRYVAFLDYDDYVYEHAYTTLINQLQRGSAGVAFGGCLYAHAMATVSGYKIIGKSNPWNRRGEEDFIHDNIFPIHTFVIDRDRVGAMLPRFNQDLTRLEDYEFLMRLRLITEFDLTCRSQVLAEYHLRVDGTNTVPMSNEPKDSPNSAAWNAARTAISPVRELLRKHLEKEHL